MNSDRMNGAAVLLVLALTSVPTAAHATAGGQPRLVISGPDSLCRVARQAPPTAPFRVTVDGVLAGPLTSATREGLLRCQDRLLERAQIQVRLDQLDLLPVLNVTAATDVAVRRHPVTFITYTNYSTWIARRELRIFHDGDSPQRTPLAVVSGIGSATEVTWNADVPPGVTKVQYVLRVYSPAGAFDETRPKSLAIVDRSRPAGDEEPAGREALIGYGENSRLVANIPVAGAAVVVNGDSLDPRSAVTVMGRPVPVSADGRFATRELLPVGPRVVTVTVTDRKGARTELQRDIDVQRQNWFSVAIADLTIGQNNVTGPAALVTGDNSKRYSGDPFASGRLAFYVKGKLNEHTRLTASADTRENPVADLFSNFGRRDPLSLLRRLDPNTTYPVYGDDATLVVDAPTQGNAYFKVERFGSHLMWGSFATRLAGTDLVNFSRGLYGGELLARSLAATRYGEHRGELTAFAADPGTIGAREEFRGTGGSLFYLQNQDILLGSERLQVEIRDRDSQILLQSTTLVPGQDYELSALQGRVTLHSPLSSVADRPGLVRVGALDGNPVYLVVTYEYTPDLARAGELTTGGRASYWVNDAIRFGATAYSQGGTGMEQQLLGGDLILRSGPRSYLKLERARSEGAGNGSLFSLNGGFGFTGIPQVSGDKVAATANRVEMSLDLGAVSSGGKAGALTAYWVDRGAGFSSPGQLTTEQVEQAGFTAEVPLSRQVALAAKADLRDGAVTGNSRAVEVGATLAFTRQVGLHLGVRDDHRAAGNLLGSSGATMPEVGTRTDVAARLAWNPLDSAEAPRRYGLYGLVQATAHRDDTRSANDRYGVGGHYRLNNRTDLSGELTDGSAGTGALFGVDFRASDRSNVYVNYLLDAGRTDQSYRGRSGSLTTGGRYRFSDATTVFVERRQESADLGPSGLMHAFGLDLAPADRWNMGLKFEQGIVQQPQGPELNRRAASLSGGYQHGALRWGSVLEYRTEDSDASRHRESWLVKNTVGVQASTDWRLLGRANFAISDGALTGATDAAYTEVVVGMAYRPVRNQRLNALVRYTYLYDLSAPGQLTPQLTANPFAQRSQVFSVDGIYGLSGRLSVGGKVGYRVGEIRDNALVGAPWTRSAALLTIGRVDWRAVRAWDLLAELRSLSATEAKDRRTGILVAVYRNLPGGFKVGLGYNLTDYSEDLTDLSYRSRGLFLNVIGKQ